MSNAVWSARHNNKANTDDQLKKIKPHTNDAGQYQQDDLIKFIEQLKQVAKEQFNPLDKKNGMFKLFGRTQNFINTITTQDVYGPSQGRPPKPNLPGRPGRQRGNQRETLRV
jgi:hypothetical protein